MDTRKLLIASSALLGLALLIMIIASLSGGRGSNKERGDLGDSALRAVENAQKGMRGAGMVESLMEVMTERSKRRPQGGAASPGTFSSGRVGTVAPGQVLDCRTGDCPEFGEGSRGASAGGQGREAKRNFEKITIHDRERGARRMYGGRGSIYGGGKALAPVHYQMPNETAVANSFQLFLDKLKRTGAGPGTAQAGSRPGAGPGEESRGAISGPDSPILTRGRIDGDYDSPTLNMLQRLNQDGAQSVDMSRSKAFEDGSKDKAGNKFDGNAGNYGTVPIEEYTGSFGGKSIRKSDNPDVNTEQRVPSLR